MKKIVLIITSLMIFSCTPIEVDIAEPKKKSFDFFVEPSQFTNDVAENVAYFEIKILPNNTDDYKQKFKMYYKTTLKTNTVHFDFVNQDIGYKFTNKYDLKDNYFLVGFMRIHGEITNVNEKITIYLEDDKGDVVSKEYDLVFKKK